MARQPYATRLVLGRSAYQSPETPTLAALAAGSHSTTDGEPSRRRPQAHEEYVQQYDSQGRAVNPRSKELARQSRRAQNDILSTVKVCVRIDDNGQPVGVARHLLRPTVAEIREENTSGLLLASADWALSGLSALCLIGLRHRLQTFGFYTGVSLPSIIRVEYTQLGLRNFLFSGASAAVLFRCLENSRPRILRSLYNWFNRMLITPVRSPMRNKQLKLAMDVLEVALLGITFAFIAPLEMFSTLQQLNLVPASVSLPGLRAMIPFSLSSPFQFGSPYTTTKSLGNIVEACAASPVILLWLLLSIKSCVDEYLYICIRRALPKPSRPTMNSMIAAREDNLTGDEILGLSEAEDSNEVGHLVRHACSKFLAIPASLMTWAQFRERLASESDNVHDLIASTDTGNTQPGGMNEAIPPFPDHGATSPSQGPNLEESNQSVGQMLDATYRNSAPSGEASQDAFHPLQHVTALTAYHADALAMHLSTNLADLLLLPLEARFVRSVALGFLSAAATRTPSGPAVGLRHRVIPLGRWFGMGIGPGGSYQYIQNLVAYGALELALGFGIWQLGTGAAWLMGRKWFGWYKSDKDDWALERT